VSYSNKNLNKNFSPNTFDTNEYISNDINIPTVSNIQKNSFESYNRLSSNNSTDIVNGDFTNKFMEIIASDKNKNSENRNLDCVTLYNYLFLLYYDCNFRASRKRNSMGTFLFMDYIN
jgi:hypothetical protein